MRPSRNTADAEDAALLDVVFAGATCDSALAAADFEEFPVDALVKTREAVDATFELVTFVAMIPPYN